MGVRQTFSYPDYTVGPGVTPDRALWCACGLYRRSGIGWNPSLTLPRRYFVWSLLYQPL